ncbi:MAG: hypothetical protein JWO91_3566 [Acidobacteriaceae bacterium]|nr:hypothetical protein [Acidobacteriaceae bacterium]
MGIRMVCASDSAARPMKANMRAEQQLFREISNALQRCDMGSRGKNQPSTWYAETLIGFIGASRRGR